MSHKALSVEDRPLSLHVSCCQTVFTTRCRDTKKETFHRLLFCKVFWMLVVALYVHTELGQCFSNCGLWQFARWSAGHHETKGIAKIVQILNEWKYTHTLLCKTAFVGWPSTESRQVSPFHNFLSYNCSFRKRFKLVYTKMWLW
jgi:hypothetical protein